MTVTNCVFWVVLFLCVTAYKAFKLYLKYKKGESIE
jgi:hypothetical protein